MKKSQIIEGLVEASRLKYAQIKGWPVKRVQCKICGEDIIYHCWDPIRESEMRPPVPQVHLGRCLLIFKRRKLFNEQ